ncbi:MAG: HNH endonuclease [Bacteroidetes bacterium]|nr:HNH endonuclease [Bacteroidota bacterium]
MPKQNRYTVPAVDPTMPDPTFISAVWDKADNEFGFYFFKRDRFGTIIAKHHFAEQSEYGWVIEYITPTAEGGTADLDNLRPTHWRNAGGEIMTMPRQAREA